MLTDEDLTRQLGAAFREDAAGLAYDRPTPRARVRPAWARPGLVAVPAVGVAAAAVLVLGGGLDATLPPAAPGATTAAPSSEPLPPSAETVTEEIRLAGMTFTYERGVDDEPVDMLAVFEPDILPDWAQKVTLDDEPTPAQVWVGQDPGSGRATMFVESPQRWGGKLTGLASPNLTVEALEQVARTGTLS